MKKTLLGFPVVLSLMALGLIGCPSSPAPGGDAGADAGGGQDSGTGADAGGGDAGMDAGRDIPWVFVIAMENQDLTLVYDAGSAPYINGTLFPLGGHALTFKDAFASAIPSEPHYIVMEAGTNRFTDTTFLTDADPSQGNSTSASDHIVAKIAAATNGVTWMTYQEGIDATSGACPITSSPTSFYAAKHDPFVFFQDVSGNPPSATNALCMAHHKPYSVFASDLGASPALVGNYTFITPNLCNDMHGNVGCTNGCTNVNGCVTAGDQWLQTNVPPILNYVNAHGGVLFIVWDEPAQDIYSPFIVLGPHVKQGYSNSIVYTQRSLNKSLSEILGLPVSSQVTSDTDFSDFFEAGHFP